MLFMDKEDVFICCYKPMLYNKSNELDIFKQILLVLYIRKYVSYLGNLQTSLNVICTQCGYISNSNRCLVQKTFKVLLQDLVNKEKIQINTDIEALKPTTIFEISVISDDLFLAKDNFIKITTQEFDSITFDSTYNTSKLLAVYLSIKQYIYEGEYSTKLAMPAISSMQKFSHISSGATIDKYIDKLIELKLIYKSPDTKHLMYKDRSNNLNFVSNVYARDEKYLNVKIVMGALMEKYHVNELYDTETCKFIAV